MSRHTEPQRSARALYPAHLDYVHFLYEPPPPPADHPELDLWGVQRVRDWVAEEESALPAALFPVSPELQPVATPDPVVEPELLQARMLNEFVYCQRLFYYEHVEGVFLANADTERGAALHEKIDRGKGALIRAKKAAASEKSSGSPFSVADTAGAERTAQSVAAPLQSDVTAPETQESKTINPKSKADIIHSRSAMLSSQLLGVVAKMDLIEVELTAVPDGDLFYQPATREVQRVTPVDYKVGAPRVTEAGNQLWDADKMQLGIQVLVLRDNGYTCDEGVIYYRATKQRVRLTMTPELELWITQQIAAARLVSQSKVIPAPLVNSPKCVRCSLAPVCLPDETRLLQREGGPCADSPDQAARITTHQSDTPLRRIITARDDERALYLNTQGYRLGLASERLVVKDGERVVDEVRLTDVSHVALFGNIQLSTQAVHQLCEMEIPIAYFSTGGWFYGITRGHGMKNVLTRIQQFHTAQSPPRCLELAQKMVRAKIRNHRTLMMRLHTEPPAKAIAQLKDIAARVQDSRGLDELLGMEGAAAATYFQHFAGMIKVGDDGDEDEIPGLELPATQKAQRQQAERAAFSFDFTQRRRRPPTDPVNALLSLAYSLLAKDCTIAALAVGLDPYVGFYHQPRHGRPALALDLMEEFRPLIAESAVLTAINNRMVKPEHFVQAGEGINLTPHGRKAFFYAYEQRMNSLITHPIFDYKVSYRRVIELQARLLARWLTGEIPDYLPMITR